MMAELKPCPGFEGLYFVSADGFVYGKNKTRLKTFDCEGYEYISLRKGGRKYTKRVHRLVAKAFISNPNNLPEINHIDENKKNNAINNLEWCTSSYNKTYGQGNISRANTVREIWKRRRAGEQDAV